MANQQKFYPDIQPDVSFPKLENEVLAYWQEHKIFEKSVNQRAAKQAEKTNEFIFYDGPPFANGLPHYGHLLTGFIKDVYARYQTIKGKKVERRFGWDCHGLPAEMAAEKELEVSGRMAIIDYGIKKFNDHCRSSVMQYTKDWEEYVSRQARWVDFQNSYKTMDINFMESVLWAFKQLYDKGLIYESLRVMPYSWACQTPLSNFETRLDNSYRQRADKAVTVAFDLLDIPASLPQNCQKYRVLAWTTTPWTLPSNLALAVGSQLEYQAVVIDQICYILADFAVAAYAKDLNIDENTYKTSIKGEALAGLRYQPIFDYFKDHPNSFKIFSADFVEAGSGTGIVHMAPGFGEDDQIICQQHDIELVCPVDNAGCFTDEVKDFAGLQVFDANEPIIIKLKKQGNWIKSEQYLHSYPHCWRTDTPLIYKAVPSWYVEVTKLSKRMTELNQQINWIPGHVKDGLFGKWLENARDWSISRNRFWGTPIPIWRSDDPNYPRTDVYGSIAELEADFGIKIKDLHRPFIDELVRPNPDDPTGKSMMRRVTDVFDCWFESGSMPYGQAHYPFENKQWFEEHFPADFIVEYTAQTRGWFYTLMVLSTALFDRPPFLNCICHGVILDTTGQKLSKRLNNYADPLILFEKYGADALRVAMLSANVVKGQELLIDKEGKLVFDALRLFIKPIWSAYHFFCLYANIDGVQAKEITDSTNLLDRYILSKLAMTITAIGSAMDEYDSQAAYEAATRFFEILNNWYIRRSRNRFWRQQLDEDKLAAYNTLYSCLINMCKALSPLMPLISEKIFLGLTGRSVHITDFPDFDLTPDRQLMKTMDQILDVCSTALFIRNTANVRIRQPLAELQIIASEVEELQQFEELIKDEVNVKSIIYKNNLVDYATQKLVINFPVLGKRLPKGMKEIIAEAKAGKWVIKDGELVVAGYPLLDAEYQLTLQPKLLEGAKVLAANNGLVILDFNITPQLLAEGIARDLIRAIGQARRNAKLEVTDRIKLDIKGVDEVYQQAINEHQLLITEHTLSQLETEFTSDYEEQIILEEQAITLRLAKL